MQHFPPLDSKSTELSAQPKIISRGGLTLATPISEVKFYRHTSDIIANKYSPQAKTLNIKSIGELNNRNGIYFF